jgi:dienelactone hydrolase
MRITKRLQLAILACVPLFILAIHIHAAETVDTSRGDKMLAAYFENETQKLANECLTNVKSWKDWAGRRETYRQQLREMLGLDPLPERTPLEPVVTGKLDHPDFTVEKLHFQSRPHLYVTGNLYVPKNLKGKAPGILYVCGHSKAIENGVSFGNKAKYQHHGAWFAQNGYVCLAIDTLQLGEIEGIHHGTHNKNMWWWNARGYTPAGVEAWNSIRALDYLESRPEVDVEKLGVTGRSGGGAYSWYLTALDDRIKVTVPVAGITNLKNHVVDDCVEGHCDCMYMVNTYRWDYPQLAALVAPRPLLIANTDRDHIFPLDGVLDVYWKVRHLYDLKKTSNRIGLQTAAGPHEDLQVLQLYALQWFNHHLKGDEPLIETAAKSYFKPEELKVFDTLPADQINTRIHETFVPQAAVPKPPKSKEEWKTQRAKWMAEIRNKCFRGWPDDSDQPIALDVRESPHTLDLGGGTASSYSYNSDWEFTLPIYIAESEEAPEKLRQLTLTVLDNEMWSRSDMRSDDKPGDRDSTRTAQSTNAKRWAPRDPTNVFAFIAPRGVGPTAWGGNFKKQTHIRRRFMLLGQTLDAMRVWDVRRGIQALRQIEGFADVPIVLTASKEMAGIALYAAMFEPNIEAVVLSDLPKSHRDGPDFLNVLKYLDVPQAVAMVAENSYVVIDDEVDGWDYPLTVSKQLSWNRVDIFKKAGNSKTPSSVKAP